MKIRTLAIAAMTASSLGLLGSVFSSAQAASLGGSGTCTSSEFSYLQCGGAFSGNDKGAQGTGLSNLNTLFGGSWSFAGDNEDGTVSFLSGGDGSKSGVASTDLSGAGAIAVKAGNSYSLYTIANLAEFEWDTFGVTRVGRHGNNSPGLSHLSIYKRAMDDGSASTEEVPEPALLLGLVMVAGAGTRLKRKSIKAY
ncbi:MAG: PEP-CTERM sorting domain-containing protein [Phormidesmis sp.]